MQIGSALGVRGSAKADQAAESRLRILVACGAAGGIAATFNAPIAGVFFALELILARLRGRVVWRGRAGLGDRLGDRACGVRRPPLPAPARLSPSPPRLGLRLFAILGHSSAHWSASVFTRVLYTVEDVCDWAWRWPGVGPPGRRRAAARPAPAGSAADVRGRLPGAGARHCRALRPLRSCSC